MNAKNRTRDRWITGILLALIAVFAIHVVNQQTEGARVDLTEDHLYSLTDGTHQILARIQNEGVEPLDATVYFSATVGKSLPRFIKTFLVYEDYVRHLLKEYELASGGRIRVHFVDPKPDSDEAEDALDFGLDGKPVNQHGDLFFFGLALQTQTGSKEVIEFLWPNQQETLEYEISRRVYSLIWPQRQRVGILAGLDVMPDNSNPYMAQMLAAQGKEPPRPWLIATVLEQTYEVGRIDPNTDHISADEWDMVVVMHPRDLPASASWALDEWIVRGGKAVILVDPYALDDAAPQDPQQPWARFQYKPASNLPELFAAWGLDYDDESIAADFDLATTRMINRTGPAERIVVDLNIDDSFRDTTLDTASPIAKGLSDLHFFMAGALSFEESETLSFAPLVSTTAGGSTLKIGPGFPDSGDKLVYTDVNNPSKLRDHFRPGTEKVVLAGLIRGTFPTAYPEGIDVPSSPPPPPPQGWPPGIDPPLPEGTEMIHMEPVAEEERAESAVLVFADVDFVSDQVAFQQSIFGPQNVNDNYKLLVNGIDFLLGADELMGVRSRSRLARPFLLFDAIEAEADRRTLERESEIRAEIAQFQDELSSKQGAIGQRNAALFAKTLQDEVDRLNERIREKEGELREIRKQKRAALEAEETRVRASTILLMPALIFILGLTLFMRQKNRDRENRRTTS